MPKTTIPQRADFYVGRGATAEYLGTLQYEGDPVDVEVWELFQSLDEDTYTEQDYRQEVADLLSNRATDTVGQTPVPEWPHPYASSDDTPWTYAFDAGTVYIYRYGVEMAAVRCNYTRPGPQGTREPRRPQSSTPLFPRFRSLRPADA